MKHPIWLLLSIFLVLSACRQDPCETVSCENGGICVDGDCDCPEGFTGVNCELSLDPCDRQNCVANQSSGCVSNGDQARCLCNDGFEGDRCEAQWTDKFVGRYEVTETCNQTELVFFADVQAGPRFQQITLLNFHNQASALTSARVVGNLVQPTVAGFNDQFMTFGKVDGSANFLSSNQIVMSYTIATDQDTLTCVATYVPQ